MKKYMGKGVYSAIAIGRISVFKKKDLAVKRMRCEDTETEKIVSGMRKILQKSRVERYMKRL